MVKEFTEAGVEAVLVALDLAPTTGAPPCSNEYVKGMQSRHSDRIIHAWATVDPLKGEVAIRGAGTAIKELGMLGFHFHPIMGHVAVNDRRCYPLFEVIDALKVPVMIDVGTTGMGAGMPGGLGARIRHAHPSAIDDLAADFPNLKIVAAHPGWPWVEEMTAVALHKGNVFWEMSGWAPKHFPAQLKIDIRGRLQDKVMFGATIRAFRTRGSSRSGRSSAMPMRSWTRSITPTPSVSSDSSHHRPPTPGGLKEQRWFSPLSARPGSDKGTKGRADAG